MLAAGFVPGGPRERPSSAVAATPRDFSYRHEPFLDAYGDCRLEPPATPRAYPYRSKACLANVRPYLLAARHDTLLPAIEALQALNRGESPDSATGTSRRCCRWPPPRPADRRRAGAALRPARLRSALRPVRLRPGRASALRTFTFGMLETVLGYSGGEVGRRPYADAVATSPSASRSATTASSGPPTGSPTARRCGAGSSPTGTATAAT